MKKLYILLLFASVASFAGGGRDTLQYNFRHYMFEDFCDACGCSASGGGMGFSSMISQNFIGVRYFHQSYSSRDGVFNNSPWIDENFNTIQAWARIPLFRNFQLSALVPYHFHSRELTNGKQSIEGVGDVTLLGMYTVYETQTDSTLYRHTLQAGAGVKAPTGKYDGANNGSVNPSFQVGTGSWDYLLAAEYMLTYKKWGINTMVNYVVKTENDKQYRFGNQLNYAGTLFYMWDRKDITLVPQAGLAGELYDANKQYGEEMPDTSGDILFGKLGLEAGIGRFSVGINGMLPINQNLTGGKVEANYRWAVNVNYSL